MFDDQPLRQEVFDCVDHEQRVALGSFVDQPGQLFRKTITRKDDGQVLRDCFRAEIGQRQLLALLLGKQLLFDSFERMSTRDQLRVAISSNQHQVRGPDSRCEVRDQVERRVVAPVQVFKNQHKGLFGSEHLQCLAHFPQHSLARSSDYFTAQRLAFCSSQQRRHLQQPHRRVSAQHFDNLLLISTQAAHCVEYGQVGLAGPILFEALSPADSYGSIESEVARERIDQGGLADACFSSDKYDLAFAFQHLVEPASHSRKDFVAPDKPEWLNVLTSSQRCAGCLLSLCDATDESITSTMCGFDEVRCLWIVVKRVAQLTNSDFEHRVGNESFRPNGGEELFFGDELSGTFDELV